MRKSASAKRLPKESLVLQGDVSDAVTGATPPFAVPSEGERVARTRSAKVKKAVVRTPAKESRIAKKPAGSKSAGKKAGVSARSSAQGGKKTRARKKKDAVETFGMVVPVANFAVIEENVAVPREEEVRLPAFSDFHIEEDVEESPVRDDAHTAVEQEVAALVREVERGGSSIIDVFEPHISYGGDVATGVRPHIIVPEAMVRECTPVLDDNDAAVEMRERVAMPEMRHAHSTPMIATGVAARPATLASRALFAVSLGGIGAVALIVGVAQGLRLAQQGAARMGDYIAGRLRVVVGR